MSVPASVLVSEPAPERGWLTVPVRSAVMSKVGVPPAPRTKVAVVPPKAAIVKLVFALRFSIVPPLKLKVRVVVPA